MTNNNTVIETLTNLATQLESIGETQGASLLHNRAKELESPVELLYSNKRISVKTPSIYNKKKFYAMLCQFKAIKSREWDNKNVANTFAKRDEKKVMAVIKSFFNNHTLVVTTAE